VIAELLSMNQLDPFDGVIFSNYSLASTPAVAISKRVFIIPTTMTNVNIRFAI
jgi:hypothetical protein